MAPCVAMNERSIHERADRTRCSGISSADGSAPVPTARASCLRLWDSERRASGPCWRKATQLRDRIGDSYGATAPRIGLQRIEELTHTQKFLQIAVKKKTRPDLACSNLLGGPRRNVVSTPLNLAYPTHRQEAPPS